jgi:hypothetical protein
MSDFEYTVSPPPGSGRRWTWKGGTVSFDTSRGGDILDWSEEVAKMRGGTRWRNEEES